MDPARWYADRFSQTMLTQSGRLQELLKQHLPGVHGRTRQCLTSSAHSF